MRLGIACLVLSFSVFFGGLAPSLAQTPLTNDQIITNFNIVAFGNEYTKQQYEHVRKWEKPIYVGILGTPPDSFDDLVMNFLDELIAATGNPMSLAYFPRMVREKRMAKGFDPNKVVNIFLIYDTINAIAKIVGNKKVPHSDFVIKTLSEGKAHCMATINKRKTEVVSAVVYFPSHHTPQSIRACVVEELTQIMGLPNDSDRITQSIFKDRGKHNELTPQDRLFLRLLYNSGVTSGMPRIDALKAIYANLNKICPGGVRREPTR